MKKTFEKHETLFTVALIVLYVVLNSYCMQNFGTTDYRSVIANTIFSVFLISIMILLKRVKYYGIQGVKDPKKYLFFIPLILIPSVNLWNGININDSGKGILCHILTMVNVGFIEEIIFRGFLFMMMKKTNVNRAIIVSALTFAIGHIVNLLNGEDLIPTLLQICYAFALGYLFVVIFHKSGSLIPCIITHMAINSLSVFNEENTVSLYVASVFLIIVSVGYAVYINKAAKE